MSNPQNPADPSNDSAPPPSYPAPAAVPAPPAYDQVPPPSQQGYPSAPPAQYGAASRTSYPGKTLGIVAFVLALVPVGLQLIGLILGIVALVQSRRAGHKNGLALAAIIIAAVLLVLTVILALVTIIPLVTFAQETVQACAAVDYVGTVMVRGVEVTCSASMR